MGFRSRSESARAGKTTGKTTAKTAGNTRNTNPAEKKNSGKRGSNGHSSRERGYVQRRPQERQKKHKTAGSGDRVRDLVLSVLQDVTLNDAYANIALPQALKKASLSGRDAAFATELCYGTLRATGLLDAIISSAAARPAAKIDSIVLDILRLGAYQIMRTRVDDHAAVHTSVELAKAHGAGSASGFVNGVLRTITRSSVEEWLDRVAPGMSIESQALRSAHPAWIAQVFNQALGETKDSLQEALHADDERPIVHLAARPGQITAEELALITGGEEGKYSPYAVYLPEGAPGDIEPVMQGLAGVQDEGSQLIGLALVRTPVEEDRGRWLDMCAGPGGKTAFIASYAQSSQAHVDATELAEHRAELVKKSTHSLPVTVATGDARSIENIEGIDLPAEGYDRILVDAPCSGLGALRRRPEARWRKAPEDVPSLVALQRELLTSALKQTRPGGIVVYSTCSPHPEETTRVVHDVVQRSQAEIVDATAMLPELAGTDTIARDGARSDERMIQLWPHKHGTDAMFIAVMRKK